MSRVAPASPGAPRRHGGPPSAFSGFIPPPERSLPLVPPGAVLRAPGALPKPGRMSWLPGPVQALRLVLEPGRGLWCPLQVPIQHELSSRNGGGLVLLCWRALNPEEPKPTGERDCDLGGCGVGG